MIYTGIKTHLYRDRYIIPHFISFETFILVRVLSGFILWHMHWAEMARKTRISRQALSNESNLGLVAALKVLDALDLKLKTTLA